jgi:hypothetical protein
VTPTKERIENWRAFLSDVEPEDGPELNAIFDLAKIAVALKPRPLAEIEGEAFVFDGKVVHILRKYTNDCWLSVQLGTEWPNTTLAIPLSALAGLMEGKP